MIFVLGYTRPKPLFVELFEEILSRFQLFQDDMIEIKTEFISDIEEDDQETDDDESANFDLMHEQQQLKIQQQNVQQGQQLKVQQGQQLKGQRDPEKEQRLREDDVSAELKQDPEPKQTLTYIIAHGPNGILTIPTYSKR